MRFIGGVRQGALNISWPFVALSVDHHEVSINVRFGWLGRIMRPWNANLTQLVAVQAIGYIPLFTSGVGFVDSEGSRVIFWTAKRGKLLNELASMGVTVQRSPRTVRSFRKSTN